RREAGRVEGPPVVTNVGAPPEAVRQEGRGLLVPPADPAALAAAIERLLANRSEAQQFARAGRALMLERFTLSKTGSDLASLYHRVAGAGDCFRRASTTLPHPARVPWCSCWTSH